MSGGRTSLKTCAWIARLIVAAGTSRCLEFAFGADRRRLLRDLADDLAGLAGGQPAGRRVPCRHDGADPVRDPIRTSGRMIAPTATRTSGPIGAGWVAELSVPYPALCLLPAASRAEDRVWELLT